MHLIKTKSRKMSNLNGVTMFQEYLGLIDLPESDYHAHPAINKSGLDQINRSPAHYKAWLKAPRKATKAMIFGTACHRAILEPERIDSIVGLDVDKRTKEGKEAALRAESEGKILLDQSEMEALKGMVETWKAHPLYEGTHNQGSRHEASAFWKDPGTGLLCKARPDILHPSGMIIDIKTTDDASPYEFSKQILKYRYHVQAAWYLNGVTRSAGRLYDQFVFVAIEKKPPYAIAVYVAPERMIAQGQEEYTKDFQAYARCMRESHWPSYPTEVQLIDLPAWAIS